VEEDGLSEQQGAYRRNSNSNSRAWQAANRVSAGVDLQVNVLFFNGPAQLLAVPMLQMLGSTIMVQGAECCNTFCCWLEQTVAHQPLAI
jgi:hypothetical protein